MTSSLLFVGPLNNFLPVPSLVTPSMTVTYFALSDLWQILYSVYKFFISISYRAVEAYHEGQNVMV